MTLHLHLSNDSSLLVDQLAAELFERSQIDPFTSRTVVVPSMGVMRWLQQGLADRAPIVANINFGFPNRVVTSFAPKSSLWTKTNLVRHILDIANSSGTQEFTALGLPSWFTMAQTDINSRSFVPKALAIADLLDRYLQHRREMIQSWLAEPSTYMFEERFEWQQRLFVEIARRIKDDPFTTGNGVNANSALLEQPLHFFAGSSSSQSSLNMIAGLSEFVPVHLYAFSSSSKFATRVLTDRDFAKNAVAEHGIDEGFHSSRSNLVKKWGVGDREGWRFISKTLAESNAQTVVNYLEAPADEPLKVAVHGCSGITRQVQVLRDVILGLLKDDPSLNESDIVIMCPNRDEFAPIIQRVWGTPAVHGQQNELDTMPALRYATNPVQISDQGPLIEAVWALLNLVDSRALRSDLIKFLSLEAVELQFGFDSLEDHELIQSWLERTNLNWGFTSEHRSKQSKLPLDFEAHSLGYSSRSLLSSIAFREDSITPFNTASSRLAVSEFELAGKLSFIADTLIAAEALWSAEPVGIFEWRNRLETACESLFATEDDGWQHSRLQALLDRVENHVDDQMPLGFSDFKELVFNAVETPLGRRVFGRGDIVIDQPTALRAVPYRVVAVLGFDEDAMPKTLTSSDDLIAAFPREGDRSPRKDMEQALCDAVVCAKEHLIITYTNINPQTNSEVWPSLALSEFMEALNISEDQVISHTRHSYSAENFYNTSEHFQSFDEKSFELLQVLKESHTTQQGFRADVDPRLFERVDVEPATSFDVSDLINAAIEPIAVFARETLGLQKPNEDEADTDVISVATNALDEWKIRDLLYNLGRSGKETDLAKQLLSLRGEVPPGRIGQDVLKKQSNFIDLLFYCMDTLSYIRSIDPSHELSQGFHQRFGQESIDLTREVGFCDANSIERKVKVHITGSIPTFDDEPFVTALGKFSIKAMGGKKELEELKKSLSSRTLVELWISGVCFMAQRLLSSAGTSQSGSLTCRAFLLDNKSGYGAGVRSFDMHNSQTDEILLGLDYLIELALRSRQAPVALFHSTSKELAANDAEPQKSAESKWNDNYRSMGDCLRFPIPLLFGNFDFKTMSRAPFLKSPKDEAVDLWTHIEALVDPDSSAESAEKTGAGNLNSNKQGKK